MLGCDPRSGWPQHGHPPVYLSLDIDCLDPAFAPGTGTPEPGGLSTNQVLTLLEELADLPFVGMDCVEVAPPYDHAELTSHAAASFVWTYLCGRIARGAERLTDALGRYNASAVVFFTVRSTSIEFERVTPGRRISTSVWKRSRSSASR